MHLMGTTGPSVSTEEGIQQSSHAIVLDALPQTKELLVPNRYEAE